MDNPLFFIAALVVIGLFFRIWLQDYRSTVKALAARQATGDDGSTGPSVPTDLLEGTLPGASPVGIVAVMIAIAGGLAILATEVAGEYALDIVGEQTEVTVLFGLYTLAAAFVEELIFRGFLYYDRGTRFQLVASIVLISLVFALLHPYIWNYEKPKTGAWWHFQQRLTLELTTKGIFSTSIVFINSLWFYYVRFFRLNPLRSLIPCFAAHLASNAGVLLIKAYQGKVVGLY
jgi:membrane protease YdiL (CAAX protease family)